MEDALPSLNAVARPGFLVEYGRCLMNVGRYSAARSTLEDVRASDHGDAGDGPACRTTEAENLLGEIALEQGRVEDARAYIMSACDVKKCTHNTTQGLPLNLAKRLLALGEYDCVIAYCRTASMVFGVENVQTKRLLEEALSAKGRLEKNRVGGAGRHHPR
jgi:tetratricopeptide (TPR) repeat protein